MIDLNAESRQTVQALSSLREPGVDKVLEFYASQLRETQAKLVKAGDMVMIHRLQGRAELLEDLLRAVDEASAMVKRR